MHKLFENCGKILTLVRPLFELRLQFRLVDALHTIELHFPTNTQTANLPEAKDFKKCSKRFFCEEFFVNQYSFFSAE